MADGNHAGERFGRGATAPRIVLYSHDTLGFGHLRRNLLLARALRDIEPTPEILLIGGMREAGAFDLPEGVDVLTLPAYAKQGDGGYRPRDLGQDLGALTALRSQAIKAAVRVFDPDLMIVDNVPRGALFELDATLEALRSRNRARIVLGLRDVIDRPAAVRRQWLRQRNFETVRRHFDAIWIYGDPALYDVAADCELGGAFAGRAQHVGYLDHSVRCGSDLAITEARTVLGDDPSPYVFCTVGGGRDGASLCEAFVRTPLPPGHRGILVTGTQMPGALRDRIRDLGARRPEITILPFLQEPIELMAGASRIVAMGGYNTTCEVLSLNRPALIVPRVRPREEQLIRAERLAARGFADMLHPDGLSPAALGAWLASPPPRPTGPALDMGGLDRVRALAAEMLGAGALPLRAS
ncbi:glycosyltransferase family protein [Histidinibacterium lentulum]|uniref:Glycosyl transferase family 28 n=1 Tax=Histidinibacterium lentulum TaxID=2480588 RepID=A0A3N2QYH1_9RHOB|nr:glycosyl transferase family 28 [Histidinibacterium lentulum]ROU00158.1 glycosyl transferase family 28 [Histidinibacterium lentulum]